MLYPQVGPYLGSGPSLFLPVRWNFTFSLLRTLIVWGCEQRSRWGGKERKGGEGGGRRREESLGFLSWVRNVRSVDFLDRNA